MAKMKFFLGFLLFGFQFFASAQINQNGIPFFRNYPPEEYQGSEQNWCIIQDHRGIMYFGNQDDGILEYDGETWRQIKAAKGAAVLCMAIDNRSVIFVGGIGDFGYLNPDSKGSLQYVSLSNFIDSTDIDFGAIHRIICSDNKVYFCSPTRIFVYDYHTVKKMINLPKFSFLSFLVGKKIMVGNYMEGLLGIQGDSIVPMKNAKFFVFKNIFNIIPDGNHLLVITGSEGFYRYNPETGEVSKDFFCDKSGYWKEDNVFYYSTVIPGGIIASATAYKGTFLTALNGQILSHFDKKTGMLDEQCTNIFYKKDNFIISNPIWISNFQGTTKFEINSPFRFFGEESGLNGLISDIIRFEGILYVSTSTGVYYQKYDNHHVAGFEKVDGIYDQAWSFLNFKPENTSKGILLAGTINGIFMIEGSKSKIIDTELENNNPPQRKLYIYKLSPMITCTDKFIAVGKNNVIISYKNKKWKIEKETKKLGEDVRSVAEDTTGTIWLGTDYDGFYAFRNDSILHFTENEGLPSLNSANVFQYGRSLIYSTSNGLYKFDSRSGRFIPDSSFGIEFYKNPGSLFRMASPKPNDLWFSMIHEKRKWIEHLTPDKPGHFSRDTLPFMRLPNNTTDAVYCDGDLVWFGISKKIYSYDTRFPKDYYQPYHCLIRRVKISEDSILFDGAFAGKADSSGIIPVLSEQENNQVYVISYKYNHLTFYWAAPFFENEESLEYSWYLDGSSENWSKWIKESHYPITNISEGDYIFKVKARNIYGIESLPATFAFYIKPPFYRTIVAYILYFVFLVGLIVLIVKIYTRKLELEKIRLEKIVAERTAEVVAQKKEIEKQRDEIALQKENIEASIHYASRIQTAILPHKDFIEKYLKEYFILWRPRDIVSGDFYWMTVKDEKIVVVAADCTGHGVPGAFMSMLGVSFLNEIVIKNGITQAHEILNHLRANVKRTLDQTGKEGEAKDGMDIALCVFDLQNKKVQFAGAYNPCYVFRNGEFIEIKADRMPIGIYIKEKESFTLNEMDIVAGDIFYVFSDGYVSQFGGGTGEKFKSSRLKELLTEIHTKPMEEQKTILDQRIDEWRGELEQVDDVLIFGVRIKEFV